MSVKIRALADANADIESVRQIAFATWPDTFRDILTAEQID